jgi:membrane-bound lytic murein transglycosylase MltF
MIADVTFTVDLNEVEAEIIKQVIKGKTDQEIQTLQIATLVVLRKMMANLVVELDLIEATRDDRLTWGFRESTQKQVANG